MVGGGNQLPLLDVFKEVALQNGRTSVYMVLRMVGSERW